MSEEFRYECALAAALVILEFVDAFPGAPKHEMLATTVFSILDAMDRYEAGKGRGRVEFSVN